MLLAVKNTFECVITFYPYKHVQNLIVISDRHLLIFFPLNDWAGDGSINKPSGETPSSAVWCPRLMKYQTDVNLQK